MTGDVPAGAVVVGVDGSPGAERAARWAARAAVRERRVLVLARGSCTVEDDLQQYGHDLVASAAVALGVPDRSTEVRTVCTKRTPEDILVDLSRDAHLLVVGSRGRGRVRSAVLGSVSATLVRQGRCPVVVVRPVAEGATHHGHGILVGLSAAEPSEATAGLAFHIADWTGEPLTVAHCFWDPEDERGPVFAGPPHADMAAERLAVGEALAGLREQYPDVTVRVRLERGDVELVLSDLARDAALVVVGSPAHGALSDVLPGSVASILMSEGGCPVAVVPHRVAVEDDAR